MKKTTKVAKADEAKAEGVQDATVEAAPELTEEEDKLMEKCYSFYVSKDGDRPQVN